MATVGAASVTRPLALVCVDDANRQTAVTRALDELGYRAQVGASTADVVERLRKTTYEVIVLDEAFQGATPLDNALLTSIQWMPMTVRRYMFIVLLGKDLKTFDNMMAFAKSVNVVVSYGDVGQLKAILERGISDNDQFYRVFRQVLQEAGKR